MTILLPVLVLLPLAAVPLPGLLRRLADVDPTLPALVAGLGTLALALGLLPGALAGTPAVAVWSWVPALGLSLALRADRAAAVFAVGVAAGGVLAIAVSRRRSRGRAAPRYLGGVLALVGATLGAVLADDLALLWCCLEVAMLASVWLVGADGRRSRATRAAVGVVVVMEAGGLALFAAALLIADSAGSFRIADAWRSGAELRAHPLYLAIAGLTLVAAATRLAPWLLRADGRGARAARAGGIVAAALLPLRLAPALGGTRAWLGMLIAFGAAALLVAARRLWRGGSDSQEAAPARPRTLVDELAQAAHLIWRPLAAPRLGLSLVAIGAGAVFAVALGANGARADAWPVPTSAAWPLVAGSAWLLLAAVAGVVHGSSRRAARAIVWLAAGALLLVVAAAPPGIALAELAAGLPALWLLARARDVPLPSRRALGAFAVLAAAAAALQRLVAGPPVAAATTGLHDAALLLLAPLALPFAATVLLFALGSAAQRVRRVIAGLALASEFALAAALLCVSDRGAPVALVLGGWPAPFGIHLLLDRLAAEMLLVTAVLAALAFGRALTSAAGGRGRHAEALGQLQLLGVAGCVLTADLLELVVFLEVLLLALQVGLAPDDADRRPAAHVAVVGAVGTGLMLIAVGAVHAALGTTGYAELAVRAPTVATGDSPLLGVGAYLLVVVLAVRAAAMPVGLWLARALDAAPAAAAVGVVALTQVGVYALLRLYVLVFPCFGAGPCGSSGLVLPLGLATVAAGGIGALAATGLRTIAPPLLLASVGTLLVGVGSFRVAGLAAAIYALAPAALAAAALVLARDVDGRRGRALALVVLPAVLGLPPFPGWIARVAILGATGPDALVVWTTVLTTALLAAIAAAGIAMARGARSATASPGGHRAAAGCALALLVAFTLATAPAFALATRTARQLLDRRAYVAAFPGAPPGAVTR